MKLSRKMILIILGRNLWRVQASRTGRRVYQVKQDVQKKKLKTTNKENQDWKENEKMGKNIQES